MDESQRGAQGSDQRRAGEPVDPIVNESQPRRPGEGVAVNDETAKPEAGEKEAGKNLAHEDPKKGPRPLAEPVGQMPDGSTHTHGGERTTLAGGSHIPPRATVVDETGATPGQANARDWSR